MFKPTPQAEELKRMGTRSMYDFVDTQVKLGRYNAWLERASRALPPYAQRSSRAAGSSMPIADDVRRLLQLLAQARTRSVVPVPL